MRGSLTLVLGLVIVSPLGAEDWPHWRGPARDGISQEKGWLDRWPETGPPVAWKANVGIGFSAISVAKGRAFTLGHVEGKDIVSAFDASTGALLWKHAYEAELGDENFEGGPTATPALANGRVYSLSRWGDALCLEAETGKVVWSKNIAKETGARVPTWGFSGSPVVHGNWLLLNVGKTGMALDRDTGKIVWSSGDDEAGYSTPLPFRHKDTWHALVSSGTHYAAVALESGKVLWEVRWVTRYGVNAADPILLGQQVLLSSGYNKGGGLFPLGDRDPKPIWTNRNLSTQYSSSVALKGFLYGIHGDTTERATLRCVEVKTGQVRWTYEGVGSGGLMAADGKLLILTDRGELQVGQASPEGFRPSGRARVHNGRCWTAPVLAHGRVYLRSAAGDLVCLDLNRR